MHLIYFDENKCSKQYPFFTIGGVLVPEAKVLDLYKTLTNIPSTSYLTSGHCSVTLQNWSEKSFGFRNLLARMGDLR